MPVSATSPVITVSFGPGHLDRIRTYAQQAEIGGSSNIRRDRSDRMGAIGVDQFVGQLGTLALCRHHLGEAAGFAEWARGRELANRAPTSGDNGGDIIGCNVDVKASLARYPGKAITSYSLPVRPRERHAGHVYVLAMVQVDDPAAPPENWTHADVHLMGWISDDEMPAGGNDPRFGDASTVRANDLHPLPPLRWAF